MSKKLYEESNLQAIANAIREKNNTQNQYTPSQMPNAILQIHGEPNLETLTVTENGNYLPGANKDGFSEVAVTVPNSYTNSDEGKVVKNGALVAQTARATAITENGTYDTTENDEVTVNVSGGAASIIQPLSVMQNGTYNPPSGVDGFSPVTVNVSGGSNLPIRPTLPSEYQEVEYVHFDGASYLRIENIQNYINTIFVDVEVDDIDVSQYVCGYREGNTRACDWNFGFSSGIPRWYIRAGQGYFDGLTYPTAAKRVATKMTLPFIYTMANQQPTPITRFYVGNYYITTYSDANRPLYGKIYYVAFLQSTTNSWNIYLIPCYRKSDNVVGMYDAINDVFYTNQGSGILTAGPNVT